MRSAVTGQWVTARMASFLGDNLEFTRNQAITNGSVGFLSSPGLAVQFARAFVLASGAKGTGRPERKVRQDERPRPLLAR